jgi:hypothetical protein
MKVKATGFSIRKCSNDWPSGVADFLASTLVDFYLAKHNISSLQVFINGTIFFTSED